MMFNFWTVDVRTTWLIMALFKEFDDYKICKLDSEITIESKSVIDMETNNHKVKLLYKKKKI